MKYNAGSWGSGVILFVGNKLENEALAAKAANFNSRSKLGGAYALDVRPAFKPS